VIRFSIPISSSGPNELAEACPRRAPSAAMLGPSDPAGGGAHIDAT
jgi:hypothetical protein